MNRVQYTSAHAWNDRNGVKHVHSQTVIGVAKSEQTAPQSVTEFEVIELVSETGRPPSDVSRTITEFGISKNPKSIAFLIGRGSIKILD